jgi:RNA polymerase sigma-70 factor (ECF subfamily)
MDPATTMQAAFDRAVEVQLPRVFAYFRRLGVAAAPADDLAQETFLIAWRGLAKVRCEADLRPWLYGIARRCYLKHRSRTARGAMEEVEVESRPAPADDPGSEERLALLLVRQAVQRLPDHYLQPLVLVYWEGLSYAEAARALSIPIGTLGWRVHKALKRLRAALGQEGAEDGALAPGTQRD